MNAEATEQKLQQLRELIPGLVTHFEFMPQSRSRNAGQKDRCTNWAVTFQKGEQKLPIEYMMGIGHHLPFKTSKTLADVESEMMVSENGRKPRISGSMVLGGEKINPPGVLGVLSCVVLDCEVIQSADFESWANEFGYDRDSRAAEQTYRTCLEFALKARAFFGSDGLDKLAEIVRDV